MHTHPPEKPKKFKQTLSVCQKADGNCFLGEERSADGGIHATRNHNNVRNVLRNTKITEYDHSEQNGWNADIRCSAPPPTDFRTRALLERFNWELFDHPPYSPDLAPSDFDLFTYLKNWLRSWPFNSNEELVEGV
jgi:hypothetical protein